ncbi:MAG: ThuA domain-containing protein [Bacteroidales bacterium]|nr:ThuA domain-containing protein [Bacteroidales bacterium]
MKRILMILAAAAALASCGPKTTNVLVLYENGGHHKPFTDVILPWLQEVAPAENLQITAITSTEPINEKYLAGFDVVLQLDYPPYTWPEEAQAAFAKFLDEGRIGWVGQHHASLLGEFDGYPMWPWFSKLLGGIRYKDYIAELSDGLVVLEKPDHPIFKGLPESFVIPDDEWYTYDRNPRLCPDVEVLAVVDEDSYTVETDKLMGDHPAIWTNNSKGGRNVYFQFGHSAKLVDDPNYKTLLLNAIHWTAEKR